MVLVVLQLLKEVMKVGMVTLFPTMVVEEVVPVVQEPLDLTLLTLIGVEVELLFKFLDSLVRRLVFLHLIHITDTMVVVDQVEQVDLEINLPTKLPQMVRHPILQQPMDLDKVVVLLLILVVVAAVLLVLQHHQTRCLLVVLVDLES